jgi:hypothetical protein
MNLLRPSRRALAVLLATFCMLVALSAASAQVRVDLSLRRSLFIRYEPVVAIVTITNLSGRELELADDGNRQWFSFHIESAAGELVPPYNPDYSLASVRLGPGERIQRAVNITPLYPITEFGIYRIRATVYSSQIGRYFSSAPLLNIEVTEGRLLWQQTVGVPGADGDDRTLTVLSHRLPEDTQLYLRIEDKDRGLVFCTMQLGRTLSFSKPQIETDAENQVHILQNTSPRTYIYTHVDLNGHVVERKEYLGSATARPVLRRTQTGGFEVVGGTYLDPEAAKRQEQAAPPTSINDRPVPLPKSEGN